MCFIISTRAHALVMFCRVSQLAVSITQDHNRIKETRFIWTDTLDACDVLFEARRTPARRLSYALRVKRCRVDRALAYCPALCCRVQTPIAAMCYLFALATIGVHEISRYTRAIGLIPSPRVCCLHVYRTLKYDIVTTENLRRTLLATIRTLEQSLCTYTV